VTLITFALEVAFGLFAFLRFRHTLFGRLSILLIFFLSIFQLSEYMLCSNGTSLPWATVGWVSITFLPVLGLHLAALLTRKTSWLKVGYLLATIFSLLFIGSGQLFTSVSCPGNYVQFISSSIAMNNVYPLYYGLFIFMSTAKLLQYSFWGGIYRTTIIWFIIGYVCFIVPTMLVYVFLPAPMASFPSVFCGFAVLLAFILARKVLPHYHAILENEHKHREDKPVFQEI
jgi:hypothetical protein